MSRAELNRQRTINDIEESFLKLYSIKGIEGVSTSAICHQCNMSRSTFYTYFDDKYSILEQVENRLLSDLYDINHILPDVNPSVSLSGASIKTANYLENNREWFMALLGKNGDAHFLYRWKRDIAESYKIKFLKKCDNQREAAVRGEMYAMALIGVYDHFVFGKDSMTIDEFAGYIDDLLHRMM